MHLTKEINQEINQEINLINTDYFTKGEYIYMAMGLVGNHRVCIAVAYKIDYCIIFYQSNKLFMYYTI